jgi:hypothetical protein
MSEEGSESDIKPRCFNVAEVPLTDIGSRDSHSARPHCRAASYRHTSRSGRFVACQALPLRLCLPTITPAALAAERTAPPLSFRTTFRRRSALTRRSAARESPRRQHDQSSALPPSDVLMRRLRTMLTTYREAGGTYPILLVRDVDADPPWSLHPDRSRQSRRNLPYARHAGVASQPNNAIVTKSE